MIYKDFDIIAGKQLSRTAIVFGDRTISYEELKERSYRLAGVLQAAGVEKGGLTGVMLPSGIDLVTSLLAVLRSGGIYVPIDTNFSEGRMEQLFEQTPCKTVITSEEKLSEVRELIRVHNPEARHLVVLGGNGPVLLRYSAGEFIETGLPEAPFSEVDLQPDDSCYIFYTSGSTGRPKSILGVHKSLRHFIQWEMEEFSIGEGHRVSQLTHFTFDASLRDIFVPLCAGATLCIPPQEVRENSALLADWLEKSGITLVHAVPSLFRMLTKELSRQPASKRFDNLRYFLLSGEPLFAKDISNWQKACGDHVEIVNLYGPSETTMIKTFHRIKEVPSSPSGSIHAGQPIANTFIAILNKNNEICRIGETGEVYIRTPYMTRGYYNNPELTDQVFVQNPLAKDFKDIIYKTGDLGRYLKDRNVEILGRIDEQVKINGIRIEPGEVKKAVLELDGIDEAYVTARRHSDDLSDLVCYYMGKPRESRGIKAALRAKLNDYMIPAYFVHLEHLPLNTNGKINKKALPQPEEILFRNTIYEAPVSPVEKELDKIWQEVLQRDKIGRKASFFEMGGTSLKATQLVARIYKIFGMTLSIRDVFQHPVLGELALLIGTGEKENGKDIPPIGKQSEYEVSDGQRRLWVLTQFEGDISAYNMPGIFHFRGRLNKEALRRSFNSAIERHEILRTTFSAGDGHLKQYVHTAEEAGFDLEYTDLRKEDDPRGAAREIADKEALADFDLQSGPLLRARLLQLSEDAYTLVFNMHHIISDGWSVEVLIRDILAAYKAFCSGETYKVEPLRIQYKDYAAWQRMELQGEALEKHRRYWLTKLQGKLPVLELPADNPRPAVKTYNGASFEHTFNNARTREVEAWASLNGASLHMAILTAIYALFYRYTGQNDIILGTPSAGRIHKDLENQIGFYVNLLALRTTFEGADRFKDLLEKVKETTLGAYEHQVYPFDRLVEDVGVARELSRSPLFDVAVILHNTGLEHETVRLPEGLEVQRSEPGVTVSKYDMQLNFYRLEEGLYLNLEYNTDIFEEARMARMAGHLEKMMKNMVADETAAIASVDYLDKAEKEQLVYDWNNTLTPFPEDKTMHRLFEERAAVIPDHIAVVQGEDTLTYGQLNARANRLARFLLDRGVSNGDNIAIMTDRNVSMIVGMFGILKAGGAYVPIDPSYPADRQLYICDNSKVKVLLSDRYYEVMEELSDDILHILMEPGCFDTYEATDLDLPKSVTDLAYTIYTSGSTGRPKGVMIEHRSAVNLITWVNNTYDIGYDDRQLFITSMCFDLSVYDIFGTLAAGGAVIMATQEEVRDVHLLKKMMQEHRITFWDSVPTTMNHLITGLEDAGENYLQHDLKVVFMSGDWIPVDLPDRIRKFFPETRVISLGGATEGTVWSNFYPVEGKHRHWSSIPYGRPLANNFFYILDEYLNPVPQGVRGELFIGGIGVARGYANDPEKTANAFVKDPFRKELGGMMYRTGDLGCMSPDWQMEFLGRKDHQVKIRGFRVEIGEVNTTLAGHSEVKEAVVVAKGERNNIFLTAYYTAKSDIGATDLRKYMGGFLPDYMIPSYFVQMDNLPLNANGKIDYKALPEPELSGMREDDYKAPVTATEKKLGAIWKAILQVDNPGTDDDFFSIGGHSLTAMRVLSWIHRKFGVQLDLRTMFIHPTISTLAAVIDASVRRSNAIDRAPQSEYYELSHAQKRLWLAHQSEEKQTTYNIPLALELRGALHVDALVEAFRLLVDRHEILRTVFVIHEGRPYQKVMESDETTFKADHIDLSEEADRDVQAANYANAEVVCPFDLENGPLLRVKLIHLERENHLLLLTIHHIVSDAWSLGIMVNELMQCYEAFQNNRQPELPALDIQYKDYAHWHNSRLAGEYSKQHRDYWTGKFGGELLRLELPVDFNRPLTRTFNGNVHEWRFSDEVTSGLKQLAGENEASLHMLFTAAVNALLHRCTGQDDIIVGILVSGRGHHQLEDQLGFYVNTLPLRMQFTGETSFKALIARAKSILMEAFEHQEYPFDKLVDDLQVPRDKSRNPLFDVMVEYQNTDTRNLRQEEGPLSITGYKTDNKVSKYDLSYRFFEDNGNIRLLLEYNTDLFREGTIAAMAERMETLLKAVCHCSDTKIADIGLGEQDVFIGADTEKSIEGSFDFEF
ncbi:amino acid adenylation domain-containing protein [Sinomicrobium weinanense]|uniref:Amino acid adenylation domain-containing protein n=1 Tax=Sinomicrobium weinanense TaxID=2842200 RepID=A0A926JQ38_9FLAO|nr:non-ribosomal peptide synthetase [Sinomicrobium weinanense]MBC9795254.1 amino acid adenylation domain-containing protein [Sinomicrobium weinanense]MBU3125726.1 amino acid adenylation domain-containing protein [Sinomicrobium weinanense]